MDRLVLQEKKDSTSMGNNSNNEKRNTGSRVWSLSLRGSLLGFLFLFAAGTITACSSVDDVINAATNDASNAAATKQATAGAIATIGGTSNNVVGAAGKAAANSKATGTILTAWGLPTPPAGSDPFSGLEEQLGDALALIIENGVKNGNTITFDPDETALCTDPLLGTIQELLPDPQLCPNFYTHVTAVLTIGSSPEDGTVDIMYDGHTLVTIGYSPDSVFIQGDLAELKSIVSAMVEQEIIPDPDLPETLEGAVRATFTELGEDNGGVRLSIEQAIKIEDSATSTSINIAATPKVFELTANGPEGTATAEVGLGTVNASFPLEDDGGTPYHTELNLDAVTFLANLTQTELALTNIGVGGNPLTLDATDSANLDFSFLVATFGLTVNGETNTITFDQAYQRDYALEDTFGLIGGTVGQTGEVHVSIPAGSQWTVQGSGQGSGTFGDFGSPLNHVDSGSVTVTGTGAFNSSSQTFNPGDCFNLHADLGASMSPAACN